MMSIAFDVVENIIEVFMDDILLVGNLFDQSLDYFLEVLTRCKDCIFVLN